MGPVAQKDATLPINTLLRQTVEFVQEGWQMNDATIANDDLRLQAEDIANDLKEAGIETASNKEIIALIAYLQRLGTDIKPKPQAAE